MLDLTQLAPLAASAVTALTPLLKTALDKGVATVGDKAAGSLFDLLKKRLTHTGAKEALTDLAAQPDDPDAQATLRTQLRKALEIDPALASEIRAWARDAGGFPAPAQVATQTGGSGNKINQVQGSGNNVS